VLLLVLQLHLLGLHILFKALYLAHVGVLSMLQLDLVFILELLQHPLVLLIQLNVGSFGFLEHLFIGLLLFSLSLVAVLEGLRGPSQFDLQILFLLFQAVDPGLELMLDLGILELLLDHLFLQSLISFFSLQLLVVLMVELLLDLGFGLLHPDLLIVQIVLEGKLLAGT